MTDHEIKDGNKLIAKFMGAIILKEPIGHAKRDVSFGEVTNGLYVHTVDGLKYHSSWDWLMPVIEKISRIRIDFEGATNYDTYYPRTFGMLQQYTCMPMVRLNCCSVHIGATLIKAAWTAIVEFIISYNTQQKD